VFPEGEDRSSLRERWIPNTGEYLRLNAYVTMRNASGAAIDPTVFFPDGVKVVLGAIDRNYNDVSAADSNITKNIGAGFSLAGGFDNWTSFVTDIDILARTTAGNEAEKRIYTNTGGGAFWLASSGHVVAKNDEAIGITCIRPLPATSATDWIHPGDDILLTASLSTDSGIQITDAPISSLDPDYLAVYD
jgi:hypothetical protein